ncbi:hypothetical protein H7097_02265 [Aeromicrobium sp.]|nr:hypothetical protein [Candidatus Saccharibacteria bacterium]
MQTFEQNSQRKLIATAVLILVIAGLVLVADALKSRNSSLAPAYSQRNSVGSTVSSASTSTTTSAATPTMNVSTVPSTAAGTSAYKDGTYRATASYYVPHGNETVAVTLTLNHDTITDVSIQNSENDRESASYQQGFTSSYKSYVVGKKSVV